MNTRIDYTLKLDLERCNIKELQYILQIAYGATSRCFIDIIEMADDTIRRMNRVGHDITSRDNIRLLQYVNSVSSVLKQIISHPSAPDNVEHRLKDIQTIFKHCSHSPIRVISPISCDITHLL